MTPKTDPLEMLTSYRPTDAQLDQQWPSAERTAMRQRIQASTATPNAVIRFATPMHRTRKPWPAIAGLVGAAAAALLVVQIMQPSGGSGQHTKAGPSQAAPVIHLAALERLARVAQASPSDLVNPGEYRHMITHQSDNRVLESWTSYDGHQWRRDTDAGSVGYLNFPLAVENINGPSPRFLATLPTDPAQLAQYLLGHVCGSSSRDEAVFVGVADMLRGDFAPTALRVAAIRVLERTGHITTHQAQDAQGHSALRVDFVDQVNRPGETQSLFFDPSTSALLQEQMTSSDDSFTATFSGSSTVDSVPATVLAKAVLQEDHADPVPSNVPTCTWEKDKNK